MIDGFIIIISWSGISIIRSISIKIVCLSIYPFHIPFFFLFIEYHTFLDIIDSPTVYVSHCMYINHYKHQYIEPHTFPIWTIGHL